MQYGVLTQKNLLDLVDSGEIVGGKYFDKSHVGPASVDIGVEEEIYEVEDLILPNEKQNETVRGLLGFMGAKKIDTDSILYRGKTYLAKASFELKLDGEYSVICNAKSSSGRNFIFTRVVADYVHSFDGFIKNSYKGEVWLVIMPLVFNIKLPKTERLAQMRLSGGQTRLEVLAGQVLQKRNGDKYPEIILNHMDGSVLCTLHIKPDKVVGYECLQNNDFVDLAARGLDYTKFFKPIFAEKKIVGDREEAFVKIEAGKYYLFATNEVVVVPKNMSCELLAMDTKLGLFFSHFAGFFDPGFAGTATLEIMSPYDMILRHRQPVAKFVFDKLTGETVGYGSGQGKFGNYQGQMEVKLPKQFGEKKG